MTVVLRISGACLWAIPELGFGAAVTWGGALAMIGTKLVIWSIDERASVHGTVGLLVGIGEAKISGD